MGSFQPQQIDNGFEMPPLMNTPPQIFGAYNADGSPSLPQIDGPLFGDDQAGMGIEESNEAKRRRIARVWHAIKHRAQHD